MRTDGYNPEIVFDKLQWPHAITIDYARTLFDESLFYCTFVPFRRKWYHFKYDNFLRKVNFLFEPLQWSCIDCDKILIWEPKVKLPDTFRKHHITFCLVLKLAELMETEFCLKQ